MNKNLFEAIPSFLFSCRDVAEALAIRENSARLACHRYVKRGFFVRLKRDVYVLAERWRSATAVQRYATANRLQVPSYLSLTTALSFYEVTTQLQQGVFESIAVTRTKNIEVKDVEFRYAKVREDLYFGFERKNGIFIATPEKALVDALYLMSLRRYRLDLSALEKTKLDRAKAECLSKSFPPSTCRLLEKIWKR